MAELDGEERKVGATLGGREGRGEVGFGPCP